MSALSHDHSFSNASTSYIQTQHASCLAATWQTPRLAGRPLQQHAVWHCQHGSLDLKLSTMSLSFGVHVRREQHYWS
eukprot:4684902-Amphidinium_carterae.2